MKKSYLVIPLFAFSASLASASSILTASSCKINSAQSHTPGPVSQEFPLITTTTGFEAAVSPGSSSYFQLSVIDPSELTGWPQYGGTYYRGGNDLWVIITPADDATLPAGITFKVIKPLDRDPNTGAQPATYLCHKTM